jgi:hypothetical protein
MNNLKNYIAARSPETDAIIRRGDKNNELPDMPGQ